MRETVLVTGITGFIAKHVALNLLSKGYLVRGTLRSSERQDEVCRTLQAHGADISALSFVEANLDSDAGWSEAASGCDYVQHIASPVHVAHPKDRESLVSEARDGALRVLEAACAADVKRVIITSSTAAMAYRANRPPEMILTENDWSDPEWNRAQAYVVSKTRAELAEWEWAGKAGWVDRLTIVNPGPVLGPTLDRKLSPSLWGIKLFMTGAYPGLPPIRWLVVDVRDVAEIHVRAMTAPDSGGRRLLAVANGLSLAEIAAILREAFPGYAHKIPSRTIPGFVVKLAANFDYKLRTMLPDIGVTLFTENAYVTELTGVRFRPAEEAVRAAGQSLIDHSIV